jgi:hypothetical protein
LKNKYYLRISFLSLVFILTILFDFFSFLKSDKNLLKSNTCLYEVNVKNNSILSIEDMSKIYGGCGGGGRCTNISHTCPTGCTVKSYSTCSGSTGNCSNSFDVVTCACKDWDYFTIGCAN